MRAFRGLSVGLVLLGIASCGGGRTGTGNGDGGGGDVDMAMPAGCTGCQAGEGCLTVTVGRAASDAMMPWVQFPMGGGDGRGTLVVAAVQGTTTLNRVTVANADFTSASASYAVDLGCLPAGSVGPRVFLDDNLNAMANAVYSADYVDACLLDRQPSVTIAAGMRTTQPLTLTNSCD